MSSPRRIGPVESLRERTGVVRRFDVIVFNPVTKKLEGWRYGCGSCPEKDAIEILFSINIDWITGRRDFIGAVEIIRVACRLAVMSDHAVPHPWWGYRFV